MIRRPLLVVALVAACGPPVTDAPPDAAPPPSGALRSGMHLPGLTGVLDQAAIDLALAPDGLLVAGAYLQAGALTARPARWTGEDWVALPDHHASRILVGGDGEIYATREHLPCLECPYNEVRRLEADTWVSASDSFYGEVSAWAPTADGVIAVGALDRLAGRDRTHVARLGPTGWTHLAALPGDGDALLAVAVTGERICVGGAFDAIEAVAARSVACLEAGAWTQAGDGLDGEVRSLVFDGAGRLVAGGVFDVPGGSHLAVLDGATWTALGGGVAGDGAVVEVVAVAGDDVLVGGRFDAPAANLARYDGTVWTGPDVLADDVDARVTDLVVDAGGDVYLAGRFTVAGDVPAANIARWSSTGIAPLVSADDAPLGIAGEVRAFAVEPDGAIIAAGRFLAAGRARVQHVARLTAAGWTPLGDPGAPVDALVRTSDGALVAAVEPGALMRWQAGAWAPLGPPLDGRIRAILEVDGELVVGGDFTSHIARWTGDRFEPVGDGLPAPARSLVVDAPGALCAGLATDWPTPPLHCWDGTRWVPDRTLEGTLISSLGVLADGRLLATGLFELDDSLAHAAVRSSTGWQPVGRSDAAYIDRELVALPHSTGAVLAITTDAVEWWDGATEYLPVATAGWTRALLATDTALVLGGTGTWSAGAIDSPLSAGIAIWQLE